MEIEQSQKENVQCQDKVTFDDNFNYYNVPINRNKLFQCFIHDLARGTDAFVLLREYDAGTFFELLNNYKNICQIHEGPVPLDISGD